MYFDVSITFWGSNTGNNHSFCTIERVKDNYGIEFSNFVIKILEEYIDKNDDVKIHFYNNSFAYKLTSLYPTLCNYIVHINSKRAFDILRHKTLSRVWLQNCVEVPQFAYLSKNEISYDRLVHKFGGHKRFVIQKSISGGGNGTYLVNNNNCSNVLCSLDSDEVYLTSPYYENNISLSCHLIISQNRVAIFPVSEQILKYEGNRISYCGNKYIDYLSNLSVNVKKVAMVVGNRLQAIDYRGICGLDFIFTDNRILLIEINPRYQGSSYLINAALKCSKLPSLFELNELSFNENLSDDVLSSIENMDISYESYICNYEGMTSINLGNIPQGANVFFDGLQNVHKCEQGVYLYRYFR